MIQSQCYELPISSVASGKSREPLSIGDPLYHVNDSTSLIEW